MGPLSMFPETQTETTKKIKARTHSKVQNLQSKLVTRSSQGGLCLDIDTPDSGRQAQQLTA